MNKLQAIAFPAALVFGVACATAAQAMSRDQYKADKERIAADYKADKAGCSSLAGNARDICVEQAKGREKVAKAELEANYKPTEEKRYNVGIARAEADYAVAKEKCDDRAGNDKKVCLKEAKAAETRAKADAKSNRKTANANHDAAVKSTMARHDAAEDKRDADYAVAKAKCDTYSGDAKDRCVSEAKVRFGK